MVSQRLAGIGFEMRNTPALTHRGISTFGFVNPKTSIREKQKPRDLHREAVTWNRQPKNFIFRLTISIRACHSNHECTGKQQRRNLAVPPLTTWPVLHCQCSRAVHKQWRLFCEEPTSGIEPLPSGSQDCCAVITPLGPRQLCVRGVFGFGKRMARRFRTGPSTDSCTEKCTERYC